MKRLLKKLARKLGLLRATTNNAQTFFTYELKDGWVSCRWQLDETTKRLVRGEARPSLYLRLRQEDRLGAGMGISIASMKEVGLYSQADWISLPTNSGELLLELGYKNRDGAFVTLHCHHIDLGPDDVMAATADDWFPSPKLQPIHQVIYELATKHTHMGGSERLSS